MTFSENISAVIGVIQSSGFPGSLRIIVDKIKYWGQNKIFLLTAASSFSFFIFFFLSWTFFSL